MRPLTEEEAALARDIAKARGHSNISIVDKRIACAAGAIKELLVKTGAALIPFTECAQLYGVTTREFRKRHRLAFLAAAVTNVLGFAGCPVNEKAHDHKINKVDPSERIARDCVYGNDKKGQRLPHVSLFVTNKPHVNGTMISVWVTGNKRNAQGKLTTNRKRVKEADKHNLLSAPNLKMIEQGRFNFEKTDESEE